MINDRIQLKNWLMGLSDSELEEIIFELEINTAHLSTDNRAQRVIDLLNYVKGHQLDERLKAICEKKLTGDTPPTSQTPLRTQVRQTDAEGGEIEDSPIKAPAGFLVGVGFMGLVGLALIIVFVWSQWGGNFTLPIPPTATFTSESTPTVTPTPEAGTQRTFPLPTGQEVTMVFIPAGPFMMGSDDGEANERPAHERYVNSFWIDLTEVTNGQYNQYAEAKELNFSFDPELANHPVVHVTWQEAVDFCAWREAELPSEAQWEMGESGPLESSDTGILPIPLGE